MIECFVVYKVNEEGIICQNYIKCNFMCSCTLLSSMEHSLSSLAFRGSITEAIAEAKQQKKLFVVYTAGENPDSKLLETSTWIDPKVSETVSKYCILLHILEGSSETLNFSAIYPQNSFPCITAVGYNGVLLWQKEGFVHADVLASSLEKAWLSLHVQETTAAFLTAALASGKQTASGSSEVASPEQVRPETGVSTSITDGDTLSMDAAQPMHSERKENINSNKDVSKGTNSKGDDVTLPKPAITNVLENSELDKSISETETGSASNDELDQNTPEFFSPMSEENRDLGGNNSNDNREITREADEEAHVKTEDAVEVVKAAASYSSAVLSNDVFLNIRLPDGSSLQVKFSMTDTLKMVKAYINENQTSSLGSFSIAIPYPRKVFNDQDMDSTLSELGLSNRQALVVVPYSQNSSNSREKSSQNQIYSSNDADSSNPREGYWGSVKRILSYANIFSYLSRSSSTSPDQESHNGIWQYSPNPSLQNTLRDVGRPSSNESAAGSTGSRNSASKSRQLSSRYGGNIHTLKHDDDDRFSDKNAFWNGNSTQFGGNDDGK